MRSLFEFHLLLLDSLMNNFRGANVILHKLTIHMNMIGLLHAKRNRNDVEKNTTC